MDIVTAITGASGALYAQRFIQGLVAAGVRVHLVISPLGRRLLHDELGMETPDLPALAGTTDHTITLYNYNDVGSKLASGSFFHDGMVIVPCSSNTLAECAHGLGGNLIHQVVTITPTHATLRIYRRHLAGRISDEIEVKILAKNDEMSLDQGTTLELVDLKVDKARIGIIRSTPVHRFEVWEAINR